MGVNIFSTADVLQAGEDGWNTSQKRIDTFKSQRAGYRAAPKIAAGDYRGAAGAYAEQGMADQTAQLMGTAQTQDRQAAQDSRQAEQDQQNRAKQVLDTFISVSDNLLKLPDENAAYQVFMASPAARLLPQEEVAKLTPANFTKDQISLFRNKVAEAGYTLGPGAKRFDANNNVVAEVPFAPQYREVGDGQTLVEVGGQPAPAAAPAGGDWMGAVAQAAPDAQVTSGYRTPERNAAVGGKPNSRHLSGQAVDLVPRPGETMAQLAARVGGIPGTRAINEGDHVHVQATGARPQTMGGARVIAQGAPKPKEQWVQEGNILRNTLTGDQKAAPNAKGDVKTETDLRKEFNQRPEVKEFNQVRTSYRQIAQLSSQPPTAAGDLSLIFSYMKMLDPGSVVREGEFATAQNAASVPDQVRNAYNKAMSGQRLNPKQRADFTTTAKRIYETQNSRYNEIAAEYRGYAQGYGVDPERIAPTAKPATAAGGGTDFTPEQRAKAQELARNPKFKALPVGDRGRPYAPRNATEFKAVKPGSWYIDTDGQLVQKGR